MNNIDMNDNFLSLREPELDNLQKRALRVQDNAVIAAGAGSGKTQVLATRFAWLIMTGQANVDEILTLTFTNKAASEMYQRIYKTLLFYSECSVGENLTKQNKERAIKALNNFSQAHIQTLDSYCGVIVRQAANRYGIKPDFSTGSSDSYRDIKKMALSFVIENKERKGIQAFSDIGKLQNFSEDIFSKTIRNYTSLATEDGFFNKKLGVQRKEIIRAYCHYIIGNSDEKYMFNETKLRLCDYITNIQNAYENMTDEQQTSEKTLVFREKCEKLFEKYENLSFPSICEEDLINNHLEEFKEKIKETKEFFNFLSVFSGRTGIVKNVNSEITKLKEAKEDLFLPIINYIYQYNEISDLSSLFDELLNKVNASKRTSGNLTFNDISELALKVLLENEDIRNQEKQAYKKIMIDEFQDNNGKNRDLLYLISLKEGEFESEDNTCVINVDENHSLVSQIITKDENGNKIGDKRSEGKLFFVGDEKQSIYKFRGAEVSVFNELTKGNENLLIPMNYNYRSSKELIKSFNIMFEGGNGIFASTVEGEKDYEAYYKEDALKNDGNDAPLKIDSLTPDSVPVHIKLLNSSEANAQRETRDIAPNNDIVGYNIAKKIFEMGKKDSNWSNYAILDKSRTHRYNIIKYLSYFNIPYVVDQVDKIFEDGIINDFYNYFKLCVYPSDKKAFSSFLTCPLVGMSITGLEILLSHLNNYATSQNEEFIPFPEDDELENKIKRDLSEKDYIKYSEGKAFFNENRSLTLQQMITTTLTRLWNDKGYLYETFLNQQTELSAEHFDMLFEMGRLADSDGKTVSWLVDQLTLLKSKWTQEQADLDAKGISYPLERQQAVQIMTIHKSKGLQFDHVFMYGCTGDSVQGSTSKVFYDDEFGVTIKPERGSKNYFFQIGKETADAKEVAEFRRLLYVGITRAKKDVYIYGERYKIDSKKNEEGPLHLIEQQIRLFYGTDEDLEGGLKWKEEAGFDYENITPLEYKELPAIEKEANLDLEREKIINNIDAAMNSAPLIKYEVKTVPRNTPSGLEKDKKKVVSDSDTAEKYEKENDVLVTSNFEAKDFGTLVHKYLEEQCNGTDAEKFEPKASYFKNLSDKEIEKTKEVCINMAKAFKASKVGQELESAKKRKAFYKAEWGFRMWYQESIFTGSIDLIYENEDGTYTIVDYKSDQKVDPDYYKDQQHCYRTAASKLLRVSENDIKLYLFDLRNKVEIPLD